MVMPSIWLMDHGYDLTDEHLRRCVDTGVTGLFAFEIATQQRLAPGKFDMSVTVPYVKRAKAAGFTEIRMLSPMGLPDWFPDEWALRNNLGDYSTLRGPFYDEHQEPIDLEGEVVAHRCGSYWHPDAEADTREYIMALRKAIEPDATVVSAFACCGEYMFPSHYYASDHGINGSPWYFDERANVSWEASGLSRDAWWRRERTEIIRRRFEWYAEPWVAFFTDRARKAWARGTVDIMDSLKEFNPRPNTIRFCGMQAHNLAGTIEQGKDFVTYAGAEGAVNVLANTRRIIDGNLPIAGLICGLVWLGTGPAPVVDDNAYRQLKLAVECR